MDNEAAFTASLDLAALESHMWEAANILRGPVEACAVVCRTQKPPERRGRVLFVNAVAEVTRERAQSFVEREHIERVVGAYREFRTVEGLARVATLDEIRANGANLSIPLYVPLVGNGNGDGATGKPLSRVIAEWEQNSRRLRQSIEQLLETLSAMGQQG